MPLALDTWVERQNALVAEGWQITLVERYLLTRVEGLTPTGKTFAFVCRDGACTLTLPAGSKSVARTDWEDSLACERALRDCYLLFPRTQR